MATFVPCASCYSNGRPVPLFGMGNAGGYLSLLTYHGPLAPRRRLTYHTPKMTLRQICRLIRILQQVRNREAALARAARMPAPALPAAGPPVAKAPEKRCLPACLRRRRSANVKRVG